MLMHANFVVNPEPKILRSMLGLHRGAETDGWRYLTFTMRVLLLEAARLHSLGSLIVGAPG